MSSSSSSSPSSRGCNSGSPALRITPYLENKTEYKDFKKKKNGRKELVDVFLRASLPLITSITEYNWAR